MCDLTGRANKTKYLVCRFVQHFDRMQLYQQPTNVLITVCCHRDGDMGLSLSQSPVLEGFCLATFLHWTCTTAYEIQDSSNRPS